MIEGKKVILRAYKIEDLEVSYSLINDLEIRYPLISKAIYPMSLISQREFIEKTMTTNGPLYNFAIEEKVTEKYIGGCGINDYDEKNRNMSVGLWIGKDYHKLGYGSDTLRALCSYIFQEMNIHKIKLQYYSFNDKVKNCYESVGFKEEGRHREEIFRFGKYHDIIIMGLFKDELIMK